MPRGSKDKYTDKQKRKADHIEEGYEEHGARGPPSINRTAVGAKAVGLHDRITATPSTATKRAAMPAPRTTEQ
jgi:hypothetical protein